MFIRATPDDRRHCTRRRLSWGHLVCQQDVRCSRCDIDNPLSTLPTWLACISSVPPEYWTSATKPRELFHWDTGCLRMNRIIGIWPLQLNMRGKAGTIIPDPKQSAAEIGSRSHLRSCFTTSIIDPRNLPKLGFTRRDCHHGLERQKEETESGRLQEAQTASG